MSEELLPLTYMSCTRGRLSGCSRYPLPPEFDFRDSEMKFGTSIER